MFAIAEVKKSFLVSIWFMFLTFPIMVIKVNTVENIVEWRWERMFMIGIGSLPGAVLGSLVLGCCEAFFTGFVSSDYEDVFAFVILVLILIFRPAGILGRSDTQKV